MEYHLFEAMIMNKKELIELLDAVAEDDLADGANIYHHPCSVAVRAITKCFDDIKFLREIPNGLNHGKSKRAKMLLGLNYDPQW